MPRRMVVESIHSGRVRLPDDQAHHARDVLRLREGDEVELITRLGDSGTAVLVAVTPAAVIAEVCQVFYRSPYALDLTIASAVPKGARADWMVEKLAELGVVRFIPLITQRSVVHPEGKGKLQRWRRLADEAAKQSRGAVMDISELTGLADVLKPPYRCARMAPLSTGAGAAPIASVINFRAASLLLLIGPEGGWSEEEMALFRNLLLTPITLGATILRVETAAVAAAAVVAALSVRTQGPT